MIETVLKGLAVFFLVVAIVSFILFLIGAVAAWIMVGGRAMRSRGLERKHRLGRFSVPTPHGYLRAPSDRELRKVRDEFTVPPTDDGGTHASKNSEENSEENSAGDSG